MDELLGLALHWTTRAIEVAGVIVILTGGIAAGIRYLRERHQSPPEPYRRLRSSLGRSILLGLELLVAADIINTVAFAPTLESLAVLAGIVVIRTFLSLALEVEIEGRWPWRRATSSDDRNQSHP